MTDNRSVRPGPLNGPASAGPASGRPAPEQPAETETPAPRRRDSAAARRFADLMAQRIRARRKPGAKPGDLHVLDFLLDPKGGYWSRRHAQEHRPAVQVGHMTSFHSGAPERFALEDADFNQWSNWTGESKGAVFQKSCIVLEGVHVELRTALMWERLGLLPGGTVEQAPESSGWTPERKT